MTGAEIGLRAYEDADEQGVLRLLEATMGWVPDAQHAGFFRWKHRENPFGRSPAWVAFDADTIVGHRVFLRWEFLRDGVVVRAARAVDTATHPDYQGRGVFSRLTLHGLAQLAQDDVAFVFNTPNARSQPGYLSMGWEPVGQLPVWARPRGLASFPRLARARVPADKWSLDTGAGAAAEDVLADRVGVERLLAAAATSGGLATNRTPAYLSWRYGFGPLIYRAVVAPGGLAEGLVVFRLRRRGSAVEAAVTEAIAPAGDREVTGALLRTVLRDSRADYAVRIGSSGARRSGFLTLPRQGPVLVWRSVTETVMPRRADWRITLGDIELF